MILCVTVCGIIIKGMCVKRYVCYLYLWNIAGDNKCEFCNDADTLSHYFAECDSVVQFWKFLKRWFIRTFPLSQTSLLLIYNWVSQIMIIVMML